MYRHQKTHPNRLSMLGDGMYHNFVVGVGQVNLGRDPTGIFTLVAAIQRHDGVIMTRCMEAWNSLITNGVEEAR